MGPQTGHVYSLTLIPSRPDTISVSFGIKPNSYAEYHAFFSMEADGVVTIDGKPCKSVGELFDWLAQPRNATVTVHPCPERYGLSLKTEFTVLDNRPCSPCPIPNGVIPCATC